MASRLLAACAAQHSARARQGLRENAPKGLRCIYSFNFYFKLVAVVEGAVFSGQVHILQTNQSTVDCKSLWPDGFSCCHANGDKFSALTQLVDNA